MINKYQYLLKNTAVFAISAFGSKIIIFLLVPLYTSVLSTSEYGLADIIITSATLLSYLFTLNIAESVLRFAIDRSSGQTTILSYGIRVLLSGSVLLAGVIVFFYLTKFATWDLYCYFFLFLNFFTLSLNQIINNYLRAIDKIKEVAISGIIQTVMTVFFNIFLLLLIKMGIYGYLISILLGSFISSTYSFVSIKTHPKKILFSSCDIQTRKEMCMYSIPLAFNGIAWWVNNSISKYFVMFILGPAESGVFAVSYKIPTILIVFHAIFAQAWNLSAIKEYDKNDKDNFFSNIYTNYNAGLVILCSILILINIPLARILFAKDFFIAWKCSSILLLSALFSCLSGITGSIFTAVKASRFFAFSTISAALINIVLGYISIIFMGIMGGAIATCISYLFVWLVRMFYAKRFIDWKLNLRRDIVSYTLLLIQIVFEQSGHYLYYCQIIILIILILLYKDVMHKTARRVKTLFQTSYRKHMTIN